MYNPEERERDCTLARKNAPALDRGTGRECESGYGDTGERGHGATGDGLVRFPRGFQQPTRFSRRPLRGLL